MIKITNHRLIENDLFSRARIRLFIIPGCCTKSSIMHFVWEVSKLILHILYPIGIALAIFGSTSDIISSHDLLSIVVIR